MKNKTVLTIVVWVSLSAMGVLPGSMAAAGDNPFEEGVIPDSLTHEDQLNLRQYIDFSKSTLEKARHDARGKTLQEEASIYYQAIKEVILESYKKHRRTELLMRMVLNDALDLTYGIPAPDGKTTTRSGVLRKYSHLSSAILRTSVETALEFAKCDQFAIETESFGDLPYSKLAYEHLKLGKHWLSGVFGSPNLLRFETAILNQWLATIGNKANLVRKASAQAYLDIQQALADVNDGTTHPELNADDKKTRFLFNVMESVLERHFHNRDKI